MTPVVCRVCDGELWWAGPAGRYVWLHVHLMRADHEGHPKVEAGGRDR